MLPVAPGEDPFSSVNGDESTANLEKHNLLDLVLKGPTPIMPKWVMNGPRTATNYTPQFKDEDHPDGGATLPQWPNDDDVSWDKYGREKEWIVFDYYYLQQLKPFFEAIQVFWKRWEDDSDSDMPALRLQEGDVLKVEGATLTVWQGPGHAKNHAVFVLEEEHNIFSGDHVLGFGTTQLSDLHDYVSVPGGWVYIYIHIYTYIHIYIYMHIYIWTLTRPSHTHVPLPSLLYA
jgi:hypothetical protein